MANPIMLAGSAPVIASGVAQKQATGQSTPVRSQSVPVQRLVSQDAVVAQVNQHLQQAQTELKLQVDTGSGRTVFQVVQQGTGQVVLQVPSAEVLGMSRRVRELEGQPGSSGALVDQEG